MTLTTYPGDSGAQLGPAGELRHLLSIEGLSRELLTEILDRAEPFVSVSGKVVKKYPLLRGRTVVNLFFEPSTRTRTTFELAAKRLSADVINMQVEASSRSKGEDDLDTLLTLQAMGVDMFVVRHPENGAASYFAANLPEHAAVMNAGDGSNAHPTQALLDVFTIRRHRPDFSKLRVAIVGDILHSRVAHSDIDALRSLGVPDIRVVAPPELMIQNPEDLGVTAHNDLKSGVKDANIVITLRLQHERMHQKLVNSLDEYHRDYGLTRKNLAGAAEDALIMHPGPINRGVEIDAEIAYGERSLILEQVTNGVAIRMAVMAMIVGSRSGS